MNRRIQPPINPTDIIVFKSGSIFSSDGIAFIQKEKYLFVQLTSIYGIGMILDIRFHTEIRISIEIVIMPGDIETKNNINPNSINTTSNPQTRYTMAWNINQTNCKMFIRKLLFCIGEMWNHPRKAGSHTLIMKVTRQIIMNITIIFSSDVSSFFFVFIILFISSCFYFCIHNIYILYKMSRENVKKRTRDFSRVLICNIFTLNIQVFDILSMSKNEMLSTRNIFTHEDSE